MTVAISKKVPAFAALGMQGELKLSDFAGKHLVLYFYPKDNTPGCTAQAGDFRDAHAEFTKANTVVVGVSRDSLKSHIGFATKHELPFELVSDPQETLCELFEVMKLKNMYGKQVRGIERSTFIIDPSGKLSHAWRGLKVPGHVQEVLSTLATKIP
jgi:thioredoxin-dependent peroxiredoxin